MPQTQRQSIAKTRPKPLRHAQLLMILLAACSSPQPPSPKPPSQTREEVPWARPVAASTGVIRGAVNDGKVDALQAAQTPSPTLPAPPPEAARRDHEAPLDEAAAANAQPAKKEDKLEADDGRMAVEKSVASKHKASGAAVSASGSMSLKGMTVTSTGEGYGYGAGGLGRIAADAPVVMGNQVRLMAPSQPSPAAALPVAEANTERYAHASDNAYDKVTDMPLSTFSIDVDTASYSNVRRFLRDGALPPADAVRIEELVNYFGYDYPAPTAGQPFSVSTEMAVAPWNSAHRLARIGLRARDVSFENAPASNLVFLIDVSGSMDEPDKLPLLKQGLTLLAKRLRANDSVSMVVYAGASGVVLPPTAGSDPKRIIEALDKLSAGGSTNGADGIRLAYQLARQAFVKGGNNRVILATDGDFNVGTTSEGELVRLIEDERKSGVFLSVLGFGAGNLNDSGMEALADHGNGNYAYIDSIAEAHKVLVRNAGGTLVTVAKDVKLQIEWNPERVASYRLIGFEDRKLAARDFNDDKKDAGDMGAGHTVTALYEIVPTATKAAVKPEVDALRYQTARDASAAAHSDELMTVKVRYKEPSSDSSQLISQAVRDQQQSVEAASVDFRWAAAVASFGMLLRDSEYKGQATIDSTEKLASSAIGSDLHGERHELLGMLQQAKRLGVGAAKQAAVSSSGPRLAQVR